jgi:hypothetical protein
MSTSEHAAAPRAEREKHMSVTGAAFIGFGSMVGAGIFALSARPRCWRDRPCGSRSYSPASSPALAVVIDLIWELHAAARAERPRGVSA